MSNEDYPYIGIWGRILGSYSYYIKDEQARAKHDKAPHTAIYKQDNGEWATVEGVTNKHTRIQIMQECERTGIPVPVWERNP